MSVPLATARDPRWGAARGERCVYVHILNPRATRSERRKNHSGGVPAGAQEALDRVWTPRKFSLKPGNRRPGAGSCPAGAQEPLGAPYRPRFLVFFAAQGVMSRVPQGTVICPGVPLSTSSSRIRHRIATPLALALARSRAHALARTHALTHSCTHALRECAAAWCVLCARHRHEHGAEAVCVGAVELGAVCVGCAGVLGVVS